jgi:hypothetical protein
VPGLLQPSCVHSIGLSWMMMMAPTSNLERMACG